ncbi:MAG: RluA family pseudouridine synthase [Candidatus Omnitrophica bacterium]|jgi:23S rRNA pseudouridine1911/1915/1917 synthase|nr:RluA family pseudouridine synthase [Candidatus Omnitrophota bacterium]
MPEYRLKVTANEVGKRVDAVLAAFSKENKLGISREKIQDFISKGGVLIQGQPVKSAHYKLHLDEEIVFSFQEKQAAALLAQEISLDVIYEDDDLAVINKQPGLCVHPAAGNPDKTLVNAMLFRFKNLSSINPERPGIVHRLDKDTSGLLVIAKNNASHLCLAEQFARHSINRKYVALVKGVMDFDHDVIELPIGRHPSKRKNMAVSFSSGNKYAKTSYRVIKRNKDSTLVELEPFTGRTHQLRVHLSHLGYPILGDDKYGKNNSFSRMALHAKYISFIHPTSQKAIEFDSSIPQEFLKIA